MTDLTDLRARIDDVRKDNRDDIAELREDIRAGFAEMRQALATQNNTNGRIETGMSAVATRYAEQQKEFDKHGERIGGLERRETRTTGFVAGVSAAVSAAVVIIGAALSAKLGIKIG